MIAELPTSRLLVLPIIGALAGALGGMLGVGGGLIMIPAMVLILHDPFGPGSLHLYKLAALLASVVVAIPAAARHVQSRAVVVRIVTASVPAALLGVLLGVWAASQLGGERTPALRRLFGAFLVLVVIANTVQDALRERVRVRRPASCPAPWRRMRIGATVGLPAGLLAGLLGVGGGIWAVPAQHYLLGIALRHAIANSMALIVATAAAAALAQSLAVSAMPPLRPLAGVWLAIWLAPGAVVGGWLGAWLTHHLPARWLRWAFHLLLALSGVRLMVA